MQAKTQLVGQSWSMSANANEMPCCVTGNTWSLLLTLWTSVDVALQVYRMNDAGQVKGFSCCAVVAY